jgi:hypothetical protein
MRKDQPSRTAVDVAANEEVKTAFAENFEQVDITNENKDELMFISARLGMVSRLTAVLLVPISNAPTRQAKRAFGWLWSKSTKQQSRCCCRPSRPPAWKLMRGTRGVLGTCKARRSSCARVHSDCQIRYAQVDITDQNKNGSLLVFSRHGMASRLPAVLLAGADLKHTDEMGNTSVWLAMEQQHEAAVEVLLQAIMAAGMDIDARYEGDARDDEMMMKKMMPSKARHSSCAQVHSD